MLGAHFFLRIVLTFSLRSHSPTECFRNNCFHSIILFCSLSLSLSLAFYYVFSNFTSRFEIVFFCSFVCLFRLVFFSFLLLLLLLALFWEKNYHLVSASHSLSLSLSPRHLSIYPPIYLPIHPS